VVSDGIHGYLVAPRDACAIGEAIIRLASDRERLSWMSRACRKRVLAAYSIERVARELALHYRSLADDVVVASAGGPSLPMERRAAPRVPRAHLDLSRPGE